MKDVWLVGDHSLRCLIGTFWAMEREAIASKKCKPYCFEFYNVEDSFYINTTAITSTIARILNSMINILNKFEHLPRFLVMILDRDIVDAVKMKNYGFSEITEKLLDWLVKQVDLVIERKKMAMRAIKMGAVSAFEPKIIWVKMLDKPRNPEFHCLKKKFNSILEDVLASRMGHYILDPTMFIENSMYSRFGELNNIGRLEFWRAIDVQLRDFDDRKTKLKPHPMPKLENSGYKLPPPPPVRRVIKR